MWGMLFGFVVLSILIFTLYICVREGVTILQEEKEILPTYDFVLKGKRFLEDYIWLYENFMKNEYFYTNYLYIDSKNLYTRLLSREDIIKDVLRITYTVAQQSSLVAQGYFSVKVRCESVCVERSKTFVDKDILPYWFPMKDYGTGFREKDRKDFMEYPFAFYDDFHYVVNRVKELTSELELVKKYSMCYQLETNLKESLRNILVDTIEVNQLNLEDIEKSLIKKYEIKGDVNEVVI